MIPSQASLGGQNEENSRMKKSTKRQMATSLACLLICLLIAFGPGRRVIAPDPVLSSIGALRIQAYIGLQINAWELDNELFLEFSPVKYPVTRGMNLQTGQEMTQDAYETHVERTLGLRQLYRRHFPWEQVPAPLQTRVARSLHGLIPREATIADAYFSMHQERIAWRVTYWNTPPYFEALKRWFTACEKFAVPMAALWITDGNGEHPRLLGVQSGQPEKGLQDPGSSPWNTMLVHDVIWSPRVDQLGFVYNNNFYTIPVPKQNN